MGVLRLDLMAVTLSLLYSHDQLINKFIIDFEVYVCYSYLEKI